MPGPPHSPQLKQRHVTASDNSVRQASSPHDGRCSRCAPQVCASGCPTSGGCGHLIHLSASKMIPWCSCIHEYRILIVKPARYIYFVVVHHIAEMYCSGPWPAAGAALLAKCASAVILFILLKIMFIASCFPIVSSLGGSHVPLIYYRPLLSICTQKKNMCSYIHS